MKKDSKKKPQIRENCKREVCNMILPVARRAIGYCSERCESLDTTQTHSELVKSPLPKKKFRLVSRAA